MNDVAEMIEDTEVETPTATPAAGRLCKGPMPMVLVHYIKFKEKSDAISEIAHKYFTTPGKISDIQKGNNQRYIVKNMKFSEAELNDAADKIRENFVRGQENGVAIDPSNKRGTATTTAEDAEYALSVIELLRNETYPDNALSLEEARAAYNLKNPRPVRAKKVDVKTVEADTDTDPAEDADLDEDDLLDL